MPSCKALQNGHEAAPRVRFVMLYSKKFLRNVLVFCLLFQLQEGCFDVQAASEASEGAILADNTMAGNNDRNWVRAVGRPHGSHAFSMFDPAADLPLAS